MCAIVLGKYDVVFDVHIAQRLLPSKVFGMTLPCPQKIKVCERLSHGRNLPTNTRDPPSLINNNELRCGFLNTKYVSSVRCVKLVAIEVQAKSALSLAWTCAVRVGRCQCIHEILGSLKISCSFFSPFFCIVTLYILEVFIVYV